MGRRAAARRRWRRDFGAVTLFVLACSVITGAQLAERLWPLAMVAAAGYGGWRWWRRRGDRIRFPKQNSARPGGSYGPIGKQTAAQATEDAGRVEQLLAELDDARRQVAKLEQDAAAHDELLERLEAACGRPVELLAADLERARRRYGPAAAGKAGGTR